MPKRRSLAALFISAAVLGGIFASTPRSERDSPLITGRNAERQIGGTQLVAAAQDPCFDYDALEAGTAAPERQDLFNHLLPADYMRWRGACRYGMDGAEWSCLRDKIQHESGWYEQRIGPRGPAGVTYGIPQAYPGEKMADHGADWRTNGRVQVRWLLDYIENRYGSEWNTPRPCRAGY